MALVRRWGSGEGSNAGGLRTVPQVTFASRSSFPAFAGMTAFPRGNDDHGASVQLWLVIPNVVRNLGGGEISRCARNDRSELLVTDRSSLVPSGLRYCV